MSTIRESSQAKLRWRQFSLRGLLLLVFLVALLFWWLQPARLDRGFFPMAVGYKWVYEDGARQDDVVFEVVGKETVDNDQCFVVHRTIGEHKLIFYVGVTDRGVWIHQVDEARYEPPFQQFVFSSIKGDRWSWKGTVGQDPGQYASGNQGLQDVIVPFGQLIAFAVKQHSAGNDVDFWLAEGVGVVKIEGKSYDEHDYAYNTKGGQPIVFNWELKEFSKP